MKWYYIALIVWFVAISLFSVHLTVKDKLAAKRRQRRVPEAQLMLCGFLGGALAEYIMMRVIHHKTKHKKFMIGLPLEIIFHAILAAVLIILKLPAK